MPRLTCLLLVGLIGRSVQARSVYVSPAGSDDELVLGTQQMPLRTPARALETAQPGDAVWLSGGRYLLSRPLRVDKAGVTLASVPGEQAVLTAPNADPDGPVAAVIIVADNVTLLNLEIVGGAYYGIKVDIDEDAGATCTRNVSIRGCRIRDSGADCLKLFNADNLLIEDCNIGPSGVRDASNAEGIDCVGSKRITIRRCDVHNTATNGIYLKGGTCDGLIESCRVQNTGLFAGILLGQDTDEQRMRDGAKHEAIRCVARNNLIVHTGAAGMGTYSGNDIRFQNNTLVDVARHSQAGIWIVTNSREIASRQVSSLNNIVVMSGGDRPFVFVKDLADPLTCDHNIYFRSDGAGSFRREIAAQNRTDTWDFAQWRHAMNVDQHSVVADPKLDEHALYRPGAASPALGQGLALRDVRVDHGGVARPVQGTCDIGAYQRMTADDKGDR